MTTTCQRCQKRPATTHQEYRHTGDRDYWPNHTTDRCDDCARALREYTALPSINTYIVIDRPIAVAS